MRGDKLGRRTGNDRRSKRHGAHRRAHAIEPRRHDRYAVRREHLEVDLLVARIDRRNDRVIGARGDVRRREGGQRREPDRGLSGGERNASRGGNADAQAGEAARPDSDGDAVEIVEFAAGCVHHPRDQRHDRFGMAAQHRGGFACQDRAGARVENGGGTGAKRGVDGQNAHDAPLSVSVDA
jgi:hypothetical protein